MAIKGYHNYRGRSAGWKAPLVVLLVLILLAACAFLVLQQYITYTDDGGIRFDLPFLEEEQEEDLPPPAEEAPGPQSGTGVNLVIEDGDTEVEEAPILPAYGERRLAALTELPADTAALQALLAESGANGFIYTVRDDTGRVFYPSSLAQADAAKTGAGTEVLSQLCAAEETVSVARFNCFHDSYYAFANMESAGICQRSGYIWYDYDSYHWLDPEKEAARDYVISLALECAQLGFDELLLEEMCYPPTGNLHKIDYSGNAMDKIDALALFMTELRAALAPYDVKLSLLLSEELLQEGSNADSGEELSRLLPLVDAVYAQVGDAAQAQALLAAAAGEEGAATLIQVVQVPLAEGDWCVLP